MNEIEKLKQKIRELNKKRYKRFNFLLLTENFDKVEKLAVSNKISKSKVINKIIKKYDNTRI